MKLELINKFSRNPAISNSMQTRPMVAE